MDEALTTEGALNGSLAGSDGEEGDGELRELCGGGEVPGVASIVAEEEEEEGGAEDEEAEEASVADILGVLVSAMRKE